MGFFYINIHHGMKYCSLLNKITFTSFQLGLPAWVRVDSPVIRSFLSRLCMMLSAIWRPAPRMSVLDLAAVMYRVMSMTFSSSLPSSNATSICSFSILFSRPTNHSKLVWSRLIQIKFTYIKRGVDKFQLNTDAANRLQ